MTHLTVLDSIAPTPEKAADLEMRSDLTMRLNDYFVEMGWNGKRVAEELGISQPRASELINEHIDKISVGKLLGYLYKLGWKIHVGEVGDPYGTRLVKVD